MRAILRTSALAVLAGAVLAAASSRADAWRADAVATPGKVEAIETVDGEARVATARGWFAVAIQDGEIRLAPAAPPRFPLLPPGALPDGRIAAGRHDIARAWLAEPTGRYDHGVLGDAVEAGSLVIERRDGKREIVRLGDDAVFEDLSPRIADLGDGRDSVIVVKSYLARGAALAVIGARGGDMAILAETPAIGRAHRWLNPAGIADFDGDGHVDIALVAMPHAVGRLELWSWREGALHRGATLADTSNHAIGTRVLNMSAVADFDGDGRPDLALPSFDRRAMRLVAFSPKVRDIARVPLPARAKTNAALLRAGSKKPIVLVGLEDGTLVAIRE